MNKNIRQKLIIAAALMIAATASAFAQGNGLAGINEATSMVSSYFDPGTKLIYTTLFRSGSRAYRWRESVRKILVRRPGHLEDRRLVVRGLYLLDCRRHYPALILPLINNVWLNTR